jgi:hypothetical protein
MRAPTPRRSTSACPPIVHGLSHGVGGVHLNDPPLLRTRGFSAVIVPGVVAIPAVERHLDAAQEEAEHVRVLIEHKMDASMVIISESRRRPAC